MADAGISLDVMGAAVFLHTVDRGGMFQLAVAIRLVLAVGTAGNEAHARHLPFPCALFSRIPFFPGNMRKVRLLRIDLLF